jgi:hypothetical protein
LKNSSSSSSFAALSLNAGLGQVEEEVGLWFFQALESHHPVLLQGLSTVTFSQQLHISFLIMEAAWWSLSYCVHSFHLIVSLWDWAVSHSLSNATSLVSSWKWHGNHHVVCILFISYFCSRIEQCCILSAMPHFLLLDHGSGMVIIMLCAFFSSPTFAPGMSSVTLSQQCHIFSCLIMEVASYSIFLCISIFAPGLRSDSTFSQ